LKTVFSSVPPYIFIRQYSTKTHPIHIRGWRVVLFQLSTALPQGGSRSFQWSEIWMEDPNRTPWQCTASVCAAGVYCWEISL